MQMHKSFSTEAQKAKLLSYVTDTTERKGGGLLKKGEEVTIPAKVPGITATVLDDGRIRFEGNHGQINRLRFLLEQDGVA